MSVIVDLGKDKVNLVKIILKYTDDLSAVEKEIAIEGKTLEKANMEQASLQFFYDERRSELYTLLKYLEREVDKVRGMLWRKYSENFSIVLSPKDKDQYINNDKNYLDEHEMYLEVEELYKKYCAVVEAFTSRGYALRNITNLRVASLENVVL